MRVAIIGAGAAGCFCAINIRRLHPDMHVEVFEGGNRALAKVSITGGGRCNLTNSFRQVTDLRQVYPRGDKLMSRAFRVWNHEQTMRWFEHEGVRLVTQEDECVFPVSQDAMQIVNTLLRLMREEDVQLHLSHRVTAVLPESEGYRISFADPKLADRQFDAVVCTIGGCPSMNHLSLFEGLNLSYTNPVPSLFTFNIPDATFNALMGTVVENAVVSLAGTKFRSQGPLLLTHWGVSGPATLKLSSHAARYLAESGYKATLCINWMEGRNEEEVRDELTDFSALSAQKQLQNVYPRHLSSKLWLYLLTKCQINPQLKWAELAGKSLNRLCACLTSDTYAIAGKSQYKEEFVTCGGVSLKEVNINTLESKKHSHLYFAGELLDVDAVTGGFNLQAAWSMGMVIAQSISNS